MPKKHQQRSAKEHTGRNFPEKSVPIAASATSGTKTSSRKKEEAGKKPPMSKVPPSRTMHPGLTHKADSRRRTNEQSSHGGSDAKAQALHAEERARASTQQAEFAHDLEVSQHPAEELGLGGTTPPGSGPSAYFIKELHTRLADLTDDELKRVTLVPTGARLDEGTQYIDLNHLERGAFVADASMVAGPENFYVAKKETDYVIWNRLNQETNPARLDEADSSTP